MLDGYPFFPRLFEAYLVFLEHPEQGERFFMNIKTKALLERSITGRDLQILELIQKQGFATRQQLFESFWKGQKTCNAHHRRIRSLKDLKVMEVTYERELRKVLWSKNDYKKASESRVHFPDGMIG